MKVTIGPLTFEVGESDFGPELLIYNERGTSLHVNTNPKDLARLGNAFLDASYRFLAKPDKPTDREIIDDVFQPYRG
jgi:hypothetical protein